MSVANIIKDQIGGKALFMLGAKNLLDHNGALSFRIGRNAKSVNYIKITLNAMDTYDIEYGRVHGAKYKVKNSSDEVYVDMMHKDIEANTGMYTSL